MIPKPDGLTLIVGSTLAGLSAVFFGSIVEPIYGVPVGLAVAAAIYFEYRGQIENYRPRH